MFPGRPLFVYDSLGRVTSDTATVASGNPDNIDTSVLELAYSFNNQGKGKAASTFPFQLMGQLRRETHARYRVVARWAFARITP